MTQDEIIEIAQECGLVGMRPHLDGIYVESLVAFAKLVAEKALAQPEQEPVAWATREDFYRELDRSVNRMRQQMEIKKVVMRCSDYDIALPVIDIRDGHVLVGQVTTPPQPEQEPVVHDPLPRACNLAGVDYQTFLKIKAYMPVAPPQPERHELQAKGEHPAPCARHCEANAFKIVIRNLKAQLAQRKPLTDEDLIECERLADIRHRKHMGSIRGQQLSPADQFLWHYARAIEAAHGIKE